MIRDKSLPQQPYIDWYNDVMKYCYRDQLSFMPNADLKIHPIKRRLLWEHFRRRHHVKSNWPKWMYSLT